MPRFSIVIATHERPLLLARAIQSVKNQSIEEPQVIVVSDADCARTRDIASRLLSATDVFVQRLGGSHGPAASRNIGMRLADGVHLIFLDDDDAFTADFLREVDPHLADDHVSFCNHHSALETFDEGRSHIVEIVETSLKDRATEDLLIRNFIPLHALVYPRSLIGRIAFDETLGYEDWEFILQAARFLPLRHADVFGPVVFCREGPSRSQACAPDLLNTYRRIYARHPAGMPAVDEARRQLFRSVGYAEPVSWEQAAAE